MAHDGAKWTNNYLAEVLFVPKLQYNCFSLSSALDKGLNLTSDENRFQLRRKETVVAVGDRQGNLYKMHVKTCPPELDKDDFAEANLHIGGDENLRLWHERLAHQNVAHVGRMLKNSGIAVKATEKWAYPVNWER